MDVWEPGFAGLVSPLNFPDQLKEILIMFLFLMKSSAMLWEQFDPPLAPVQIFP